MKKLILYSAILIGLVLSAYNIKIHEDLLAGKTANDLNSALEGNWELVVNEINGKKLNPRKNQQFKMFHDGYFSFVMYDESGNFSLAGAGPYEINGNTYIETHKYSSDPKFIGAKDWQKWEMKGDTLIFYGFEKVILADGIDVTKDMGGLHFVEKRVRVKK
ncbi:hypothetical protein BH23BAC1_BH23BAC1_08710 [soil metagenome]